MKALPLLFLVMTGCVGCITSGPIARDAECLRLMRCEIAWHWRDLEALNLHRCESPAGFSQDEDTHALIGREPMDCPWQRAVFEPEDDTEG